MAGWLTSSNQIKILNISVFPLTILSIEFSWEPGVLGIMNLMTPYDFFHNTFLISQWNFAEGLIEIFSILGTLKIPFSFYFLAIHTFLERNYILLHTKYSFCFFFFICNRVYSLIDAATIKPIDTFQSNHINRHTYERSLSGHVILKIALIYQ